MELIYKSGHYFLRKTHDFCLTKSALSELTQMKLKNGQQIAGSHFDVLAASHKIAIRKEDFELFDQFKKMQEQMEDNDDKGEINCSPEIDTLSELAESIRSLQERFSDFGVVIEAKIVAS